MTNKWTRLPSFYAVTNRCGFLSGKNAISCSAACVHKNSVYFQTFCQLTTIECNLKCVPIISAAVRGECCHYLHTI